MAGPQVQCESTVKPEQGLLAEVEPRRSSQPPVMENLDRKAKELLRTIADAQSVLMKANFEFSIVFPQICAQLPPRKPSRDKKNLIVAQDIYDWSEEAEEQTGAQVNWKGLIKQVKARQKQKGTESGSTPAVESDHGKCSQKSGTAKDAWESRR